MTFGAFCPGLRLRDDQESGLNAPAQSRLALDVAAMKRSMPFAVLSLEVAADEGPAAITRYRSQDPEQVAPSVGTVWNDPSNRIEVTLEWPLSVPGDDDAERGLRVFDVTTSSRSAVDAGPAPTIREVSATRVVLWIPSAATLPIRIDLLVRAEWGGYPSWRDYGGHPEKKHADRERIPYAAIAYDDIEAGLGSAFTTERTGLVHVRKLVLARRMAGVMRARERAVANSIPGTSTDLLATWVRSLRVPVRAGDPEWLQRDRADRAFRTINPYNLDDLAGECRALLGDYFVRIDTEDSEDFDASPPGTFWVGGEPGSPLIDLGGGTWMSKRQHLVIRVRPPRSPQDPEFDVLMNVQLRELLTTRLPGTFTFRWALDNYDGFILNQSLLNFDTF